jgi:thiol-disulfide isomerase/thioredoxin
MMRRFSLLLQAGFLAALFLGCDFLSKARPAKIGADVSTVSFQDEQGKRLTLAEYKGKVVLVDVWATWCPPCRASLPEIIVLQRKAETDSRFAVLAVSLDQGGFADIEAFRRDNPNMAIRSFLPLNGKSLEPFGEIPGIPTTLVIGRDGKLIKRWSGYYEGRAEKELMQALTL